MGEPVNCILLLAQIKLLLHMYIGGRVGEAGRQLLFELRKGMALVDK
jgi:hypothetical protein